jgi:Scavenger receptor cysteine-rich domain
MLTTVIAYVRLVFMGFHLLRSYHLFWLTSGDCASAVPDVFNAAYQLMRDADFADATVSLYDTRAVASEDNVTLNRVPFHHGYADTDAGNVLVYSKNKLWAVCDDGWNLQTASVVCGLLGYRTASQHTVDSYFGQPPHGKYYFVIYIRNTFLKLHVAFKQSPFRG